MKLSRIRNCVNIAASMLLLLRELSLRLRNCPDVRHSFRSPSVHVIVKRNRVFYSLSYTSMIWHDKRSTSWHFYQFFRAHWEIHLVLLNLDNLFEIIFFSLIDSRQELICNKYPFWFASRSSIALRCWTPICNFPSGSKRVLLGFSSDRSRSFRRSLFYMYNKLHSNPRRLNLLVGY